MPVTGLDEVVRKLSAVEEALRGLLEAGPTPEVLTREEAAKFLRISVSSLKGLVRLGRILPLQTLGRRTTFSRDELRRFVADSQMTAPKQQGRRPRLPPIPTATGRRRSVADEIAKVDAFLRDKSKRKKR